MTFGHLTKDILWMYNGIRYDVCILLFSVFLIYASTFYHSQRLLRGNRNPRAIWTLVSAFIDQDNFSINWNDEKYSRFFVVWSLVMSIGSLFSTSYFDNCACTDLVVYTKPWAPVSYQVSGIFLFLNSFACILIRLYFHCFLHIFCLAFCEYFDAFVC